MGLITVRLKMAAKIAKELEDEEKSNERDWIYPRL
jgi:hypothetical protein